MPYDLSKIPPSGNLGNFLNIWQNSDARGQDSAYYDTHGEDVLNNMRNYDPNAYWEKVDGHNEGDNWVGDSYNMKFDETKLPRDSYGNSFRNLAAVRQENGNQTSMGRDLRDGKAVWDSPYGKVTSRRNMQPEKSTALDRFANTAWGFGTSMLGPAGWGINAARTIGDTQRNGGKVNWGRLAGNMALQAGMHYGGQLIGGAMGQGSNFLPPGVREAYGSVSPYLSAARRGYSAYNAGRYITGGR